jgi:hypothetical protein
MAFVVDTVLSFAFSTLSNWVFPKDQPKSQDSVPNGDFGSPLYWAWGTTLVPGTLMYILDPSLNNRVQLDKYTWSDPVDSSSYAHFLHVNPSNTTLRALRINGSIVATNISDLPLDKDNESNKVGDSVTGGQKFDNLNYRFYDGTQTVTDPVYAKQGHSNLIYNGISVLVVDSALRKLYGGRGSALTAYITNNPQNSLGGITYAGTANTPTNLLINTIAGITVPNGWISSGYFSVFNGPASIIPTLAIFGMYAYFVIGTGSETQVNFIDNTLFSISLASTPVSVNPPGVAGKYSIGAPFYTGTPEVILTDKVLVCAKGGTVREVILSSTVYSPFYSQLGEIKDSAGTTHALCGLDEAVVGWAGKMFIRGSAPTLNTTPNTQPPTGTTTLVSIITELLAEKGITATYTSGFDEEVIGFNTRATDIAQDIINLLTVFNKVVYEDRQGNLVFSPYPDDSNTVDILISGHLSEPEIVISPKSELPDAVNFGFRDTSRQYDSNSVKVGGSDNNIRDFSLEISLDPASAQYRAWVVRNRLRNTFVSGTLHLTSIYSYLEANDVCVLKALNSNDLDLKILITRIEQGADLSLRVQFVNWSAPATYQDFQNQSFSNIYNPGVVNPPVFRLIDTEPRSSSVGLTVYTETSSLVTTVGSSLVAPTTNFLRGVVSSISNDKKTISISLADGLMSILPFTDYYVGGSWIRCGSVTSSSGLAILNNVTYGFYGSKDSINVADELFGLAEENTFNNSYLSYTASSGSASYTLSPETKKRINEPTLAQLKVSAGFLYLRRKQLGFTDDGNFGSSNLVPLPSVVFIIKNLTTSATIYETMSISQDYLEIPYSSYTVGDLIQVQQKSSSTAPVLNSPINIVTAI